MTRSQRQIEEHRQGDGRIEVVDALAKPVAGVPVWVEQETHAFSFGGIEPDLTGVGEAEKRRCSERIHELFNQIVPANWQCDPTTAQVHFPNDTALSKFLRNLDALAAGGLNLVVMVSGRELNVEHERAAAERAAEVYTLCFAHPAVTGIYWTPFWDGETGANGGGLLRHDFSPKPAYRYLSKLIGTTWHSRAMGETDREGRFRFRGFLGDYRVAARIGEAPATSGLLTLCWPTTAVCRFVLRSPG